MKIRHLLAAAVAAVCLHAAVSAPAQAQDARPLKFGYILAPDSQLGAGAAAFAAALEKQAPGRYKIDQFPNSTLGGEVEMIKGIQIGAVDLAFITGAPLPNFVPEAGVINIPFLFRDTAHAYAVLDGPIGQDLLTKFAAKDIVALAWGENGMRHLTNAKRPVTTPADVQGLKLRTPQSEVIMAGFKALNADASPLPFPQLYDALKAGQFDGQENPIATIIASKFDQVQKHLTLTAHVYDPAVVVVSPDLWAELSDTDKTAFTAAAKAAAAASRTYAAEAEAKGVAQLEKAGMQVVRTVDRAAFAKAVEPAMPALEAKFGADLVRQIRSAQ
ncbi:tripartite ATP-independent transporter DctP family solute receptor [Azospirillum fermentarium]|uniref:DctP family TRAP transporter solute-binding subunit n=1 Tax=Azospirillum fermentarium TaxID=1233114 RepID=UPI002226E0F9|nr:DctP family TRAP transporter solute-binding subunit [Azospirillum fermentarium]MCW2244952.1 tripartite ATP-independent transporter DctP family solute receptor [Azospirillum fermentarium]